MECGEKLLGFNFAIIISTIFAMDCPNVQERLASTKKHLLIGDLETTQKELTTIEKSITCTLFQPKQIGAFWLLDAISSHIQEKNNIATKKFAAAHRLTAWDPVFGEQIYKQYLAARPSNSPSSKLTIDIPRGYTSLLNGKKSQIKDFELPIGLYSLQIVDRKNNLHFGEWIEIYQNEDLHLSPKLAKNKTWLYTGLGFAGSSILLGSLTKYQDHLMTNSKTIDELNRNYGRQKIFAVTTISLSLASMSSFGIYWFGY